MHHQLTSYLNEDERRIINNVHEAAIRIWNRPLHRDYTDHTVSHSERVIEHLNGLTSGIMKSAIPLSRTEILILLAAAYLHDIGMQDERFKDGDLEEIRNKHHELSADLIYARKVDTGLPNNDPGLIEAVALVSKGHRKVNLDGDEYKPLIHGSEKIKLQLLAALLRLADELDIDYRRVFIEQREIMSLPLDSEFHWWKCYYVSGVSIEDEYIRIAYYFPEGRQDYKELIAPLIENEIRDKHDALKDIFHSNGVKVALATSDVRYLRSVQSLPQHVEDFVRKKNTVKVVESKDTIQSTVEFASGVGTNSDPGTEFVNREEELEFLNVKWLRTTYTLITAPAGYGKSYLLHRLIQRIEADQATSFNWACCYVDFSQISGLPFHRTVVQKICGQSPITNPDSARDMICNYIFTTLACPSVDKRRSVLLIFDAVERLNPRNKVWFYALLNDLRKYPGPEKQQEATIVVRIIITGRDVDSFWDGYVRAYPKPPAPRKRPLSPFEDYAVQELATRRAQVKGINLDEISIAKIVEEVLYLSGGHPQIIRGLINELIGHSLEVSSALDHFTQHREQMVRKYLSPVADEHLNALGGKLGETARVLSIFRRVNANTVEILIRKGLLPVDTNEIGLLGDMVKANLLQEPSGFQEPFYRDNLMRRVLALDMAYWSQKDQALYQQLNKTALELYESWIQKDILPDSLLKNALRFLSVVEWLFHALQEENGSIDLLTRLKEHILALSSDSNAVASNIKLFVSEIKKDSEINYLLHCRFGENGFSVIQDHLCN